MVSFGAFARKIFGSSNDRRIKGLRPRVAAINALENDMQALSDEALRAKTDEFRKELAEGKSLDDLLVPAFAAVREAARRAIGLRPFDVQLVGGMVLHGGGIAEMRTGEGKTLVATLPVYLNALSGKGVHVVTVNDYLARRDAEWMGRVYSFLGLTTGIIVHGLSDEERKDAYACDITYATNNELGFDYLRDNMKYDRAQMVQRGHNFAIVDEVDSILIDEARTPLIISGPLDDRSDLYNAIDAFIPRLEPSDYEVDEKQRTATFTEDGTEKMETMLREAGMLKGESLYDVENVAIVHHVNNALKAHRLFQRADSGAAAAHTLEGFPGNALDTALGAGACDLLINGGRGSGRDRVKLSAIVVALKIQRQQDFARLGLKHEAALFRFAVAAVEGECRPALGAGDGDILISQLSAQFGGTQRDAVHSCSTEPHVHVLGIGSRCREIRSGSRQAVRASVDDLLKSVAGEELRLRCLDGLCHGEVITCLRFLHVGDRRQADFEALFGQFPLLGHGIALGDGEAQGIVRRQHVEVGGGDAQQQILLGLCQVDVGQRHLAITALVVEPGLAAINRLGQKHRDVFGLAGVGAEQFTAVSGRILDVVAWRQCALGRALAADGSRSGELRQQEGACLRPGLQRGLPRKDCR